MRNFLYKKVFNKHKNWQSLYFSSIKSFIWPLARPASPDETITVELRQQSSNIFGSTSSSRGSGSSSSKVIGHYIMLVQGELSQCFCSLRVSVNLWWKFSRLKIPVHIHSLMVENIYLKDFNNNFELWRAFFMNIYFNKFPVQLFNSLFTLTKNLNIHHFSRYYSCACNGSSHCWG